MNAKFEKKIKNGNFNYRLRKRIGRPVDLADLPVKIIDKNKNTKNIYHLQFEHLATQWNADERFLCTTAAILVFLLVFSHNGSNTRFPKRFIGQEFLTNIIKYIFGVRFEKIDLYRFTPKRKTNIRRNNEQHREKNRCTRCRSGDVNYYLIRNQRRVFYGVKCIPYKMG